MASLLELAVGRLSGQLPVFPGATVAEQLQNGRTAAETALRRHVPGFAFDVTAASATLAEVDAWAERNQRELAGAFADASVDALPAELALELGQKKAAAFVLAIFTVAAAGLGPWTAGAVGQLVAAGAVVSGTPIRETWALEDATQRLEVFGTIVRLEADGHLAEVFAPAGAAGFGRAGLGLGPGVIVLVAVLAVIFAAAIVIWAVWSRRLELNNRVMADICEDAKKKGNEAVLVECLKATRDLQLSSIGEDLGGQLTKAALVVGGAYLAVKYFLPAVLGSRPPSQRSLPSRSRRVVIEAPSYEVEED